MANYRKSVEVKDLSPGEVEMISRARITEGQPYNMDDIPVIDLDDKPVTPAKA